MSLEQLPDWWMPGGQPMLSVGNLYRCLEVPLLYQNKTEAKKGLYKIYGFDSFDYGGYRGPDTQSISCDDLLYVADNLNIKVDTVSPSIIFLVVKVDKIDQDAFDEEDISSLSIPACKVIANEKIGWILPRPWMKFKSLENINVG